MSNFVNMFITREDGFWNVNPKYQYIDIFQ